METYYSTEVAGFKDLKLDKEFVITSGCLEKILAHGPLIDSAMRQQYSQLKTREKVFTELGGILLSPAGDSYEIKNCALVPCKSNWVGASYSADDIAATIEKAKAEGLNPVGWFHFHPGKGEIGCSPSITDYRDIGIRFNDIQVPVKASWKCECSSENVIEREALGLYSMILTTDGAYQTYLSVDEILPDVIHLNVTPKIIPGPLKFSTDEIRKEIMDKVKLQEWYVELAPNLAVEEALNEKLAEEPSVWHFLTKNRFATVSRLKAWFKKWF